MCSQVNRTISLPQPLPWTTPTYFHTLSPASPPTFFPPSPPYPHPTPPAPPLKDSSSSSSSSRSHSLRIRVLRRPSRRFCSSRLCGLRRHATSSAHFGVVEGHLAHRGRGAGVVAHLVSHTRRGVRRERRNEPGSTWKDHIRSGEAPTGRAR